jgi:soluble lytic murein transglycosylase-like protein
MLSEYTVTVKTTDLHKEPSEFTEYERLAQLSPENLLRLFSIKYGVDYELARAIINCESGFDRTVKNPSSSASGYWQFINGTWSSTIKRMGLPADTDKHDPVYSMQAGAWLLANDGSHHWDASKQCWG